MEMIFLGNLSGIKVSTEEKNTADYNINLHGDGTKIWSEWKTYSWD